MGVKQPGQSVLTDFEEKVKFKNGRYLVSLPWKVIHTPLPDNYELALKRLRGLQRRLRQQPAGLKYDAIIQEQIKQGVDKVVAHPTSIDGNKMHYLPHHTVVRQDKATTKTQIVYNTSTKTTGPSLNDCLYAGPTFDQRIMDDFEHRELHLPLILNVHSYKLVLINKTKMFYSSFGSMT